MAGIKIKKSKRGTFRTQASRMGLGVQEAASKILSAPKGRYTPVMRRKANFAHNFARQGGFLIDKSGIGEEVWEYGIGGFFGDVGRAGFNSVTGGMFADKMNYSGGNPALERMGNFGAGLSSKLGPAALINPAMEMITGEQNPLAAEDNRFYRSGRRVGGVAGQVALTAAGAAVGMPQVGAAVGGMMNQPDPITQPDPIQGVPMNQVQLPNQQPQLPTTMAKGGFFNGPSHENGGIMVGPNSEVEGDEYNHKFKSGSNKGSRYIFRTELKKDAGKIEKKYKHRKHDKIAQESKDREFEMLVDKNESMRTIPKSNMLQEGDFMRKPFSLQRDQLGFDNDLTQMGEGVLNTRNLNLEGIPFTTEERGGGLMDFFGDIDYGSLAKGTGKFLGKYGPTLASGAASIGMNLKGLKATPEVESLERISAPEVDYSEARRQAERRGERSKASLYRRTKGLARSKGLMLNALRMGTTEVDRVSGEQIGSLIERQENINKQLGFEADRFNVGQATLESDINARNRAAAEAQREASRTGILDSLRGVSSDLMKQTLLSKYYPKYTADTAWSTAFKS